MANKNTDLMMRLEEKGSRIRFLDDNTFKIHIGGNGNLSWLKENGRSGQGSLETFGRLYDKHEQLSAPDSFSRIGVDYEIDGQNVSFLGTVARIRQKSNGKFVIKATLEDDYKARDGSIENNDVTGHAFRRRHNNFNAPQEAFRAKNPVIHIDTFTHEEIKDEVGGNDLQTKFDLTETANVSFEIPESLRETALISSADTAQAFDASFALLNWTKNIPFSGTDASLGLTANITPSVSASFNAPDSWWEHLDPYKYSVDLGIGLNWASSVSLNTGSNNGTFPLANETFTGPDLNLPIAGPLSANLSSGLDLSATATIPGLQSKYTLGASQTLGYSSNVSLNGITSNTTDSGVQTTVPTFDNITGLELSATASPYIDLSIGMLVPSEVPFYGGDSLASVDGKLALPVTFDMEISGNPAATIGISATYDAGVEAMTFLPGGGLNKTLASGNLFSWTSDNLF